MSNPLQLPLQKLQATIQAIKPALVDAIGVEVLHFVDDNFAKQGFQGVTFEAWPKLQKPPKGKPRKILVDTGTLRRSFTKTDSEDSTTISTDVPYAKIHNEGGDIAHPSRSVVLNFKQKKGTNAWRFAKQKRATLSRKATIGDHVTHMPKRQFIGNSPVLTARCEKVIIKILKEAVR